MDGQVPEFLQLAKATVLSTEQINDLHRLYWSEHWPIRKIERHLRMGWHTIRKYLNAPAQGPAARPRTGKLDAFKATIAEWLEKDATVSSAVIELCYCAAGRMLLQHFQPCGRAAFQVSKNSVGFPR